MKDTFLTAGKAEVGRQGSDAIVHPVGLYPTSCSICKSRKFSGLSGNRTFSFLDAGLLTLSKLEFFFQFFFKIFSSIFLFVCRSAVDTKFVSRDLISRELMTKG